MVARFKKIENYNFDISKLLPDVEKLIQDKEKNCIKTQMSLQTNGNSDWETSTGSHPGESEDQWDKLHPELVGTVWEEFFDSLPMKVYRTRIMTMLPRTCYSIHKDDNPRLHMALRTHNQCKFIFTAPPSIIHIPADGNLWWVDTREYHTAINASLIPRIHLLMSLVNNDPD